MSDSTVHVNANDVVAFLAEIAALVLLGVAGWQADASTLLRVVLAVGLPVMAGVLWGLFAAPRARVESGTLRLLTQVLVLGAGIVAGFVVLPVGWALLVGAVVTVNLVLTYVGPFARRSVS